jgi:hypothetical protein
MSKMFSCISATDHAVVGPRSAVVNSNNDVADQSPIDRDILDQVKEKKYT